MKHVRGLWLGLLFAACVARLWLMALPSSFWVDETVTAFVVGHPHDPSLAVAPQVPDSLYYWLPRAAIAIAGPSEIVYRMPSILAMLAAIWIVARLAARLIHRDAAWFAAFACLGLRGIDYFAVDARPYGLGMAVAAAAAWFLVRWLDTARWADALGFALCAALVWRVHLVYWPFYLMLALYAGVRLFHRETPVDWCRAVIVFAAVGVALLPVALNALALERQAKAHVIVSPPSWRDFLHLLRYNLVLIAFAGAWLVSRIPYFHRSPVQLSESAARAEQASNPGALWADRLSSRHTLPEARPSAAGAATREADPLACGPGGAVWPRPGQSSPAAALIFAWWLIPPTILYLFSIATGESVYLTRYLSLALPGAALAATWAAARFLPSRYWHGAAALAGIGALVLLGQWDQPWPPHEKSDWRSAAAAINQAETAADVPVICPSPFIEARPGVWRPGYPLPGFLYAHLAYYPLRTKPLLFPFADSPQAESYAVRLLAGRLIASRAFLIYGGSSAVRFWQKWFAARPELSRWTVRRDEFGDIYLARFQAGR